MAVFAKVVKVVLVVALVGAMAYMVLTGLPQAEVVTEAIGL